MKGGFRAAAAVDVRLHTRPLSIFVFLVSVLIMIAIVVECSNLLGVGDPHRTTAEEYRQQLADIEQQLAALSSSPVDPAGHEGLLFRKAMIERCLATGTYTSQYIELVALSDDYSDYGQRECVYFMFGVVIAVIAFICAMRGAWRMSEMCSPQIRMLTLGDRSRGEMLAAGFAFDAVALTLLTIVAFAMRSILAASRGIAYFYVYGAAPSFGSVHELFFAQFLAALALGAACYLGGFLAATISRRSRALVGVLIFFCVAALFVAIAATLEYVVPDGPTLLLQIPLFGVAFSLAGFREYPYWVQLALCALAIAAFLPLSVRKYKRISL